VTLIDVDDGGEDIDSGHAWMTTVKAIEWTVADIQEKKSVGMAVINISTGFSSGCEHINMAVQGAIDAGVTVVVSARNTDEEAANVCPANHKAAITVGAIDHNYERSYFSNHGEDVDIFAPGSNITGPYVDGPDSFGVEDGTSFAAPYVSGVIAYLMTLEGSRTPEDMWKRLEHVSVKGKVKDTKKAQNRLLYNGVGGHFGD
jgi:oryzin